MVGLTFFLNILYIELDWIPRFLYESSSQVMYQIMEMRCGFMNYSTQSSTMLGNPKVNCMFSFGLIIDSRPYLLEIIMMMTQVTSHRFGSLHPVTLVHNIYNCRTPRTYNM